MARLGNRGISLALFIAGISPFLVNGLVNPSLYPAHKPLYWAFEFISWIAIPAILYGLAYRLIGLRPDHIGFHARVFGRRSFLMVMILCLIASPIDLAVYSRSFHLFSGLLPGDSMFRYQSVVPTSGEHRAAIILYFAITAGLVEEAYFRGFFWRIAEQFSAPKAVYLIFSPLFFALVHWEGTPAGVAAAWVVGMVSAFAYLGLGNLWPLVVGHIFTDWVWLQWTSR